jgi:hypothetical protein
MASGGRMASGGLIDERVVLVSGGTSGLGAAIRINGLSIGGTDTEGEDGVDRHRGRGRHPAPVPRRG